MESGRLLSDRVKQQIWVIKKPYRDSLSRITIVENNMRVSEEKLFDLLVAMPEFDEYRSYKHFGAKVIR